jgi:hypothetical protein
MCYLSCLEMMEPHLTLPASYAERIRRILPFKVRHRYETFVQPEMRIILDPWRWLEDTPPAISRHTPTVSTPAPFTPNTAGASLSNTTGNTASSREKTDTRNDTPLSLALFRARRLQPSDSTLVRAARADQIPRTWTHAITSIDLSTDASTSPRPSGHTSPEPGELTEMDVDQKPILQPTPMIGQKRPAEAPAPDV